MLAIVCNNWREHSSRQTRSNEVIGVTINQSGLLKVKATKVGQDTVLSQIITLVENARMGRPLCKRWLIRFQSTFVPAVIAVAVGVGL
jgi:Cu+-exporting ATPase